MTMKERLGASLAKYGGCVQSLKKANLTVYRGINKKRAVFASVGSDDNKTAAD
jgi:hypothetical protein